MQSIVGLKTLRLLVHGSLPFVSEDTALGRDAEVMGICTKQRVSEIQLANWMCTTALVACTEVKLASVSVSVQGQETGAFALVEPIDVHKDAALTDLLLL